MSSERVTKYREDDSFHKYLHEINKEKQNTQKKEVELARDIRNGDLIALHRLVNANLKFVVSVDKN